MLTDTHCGSGIEVLVYVGTNDLVCNFKGNYRMLQELDWSGHDAFQREAARDWMVDGRVAGETKRFGRLTWATIRLAGHLVRQTPLDHS